MNKDYEVVELGQKKNGYENRIEDLLKSFVDSGEREAEIYVFKYRGKTQQQGLNLIETYPADLHTYSSLFHTIRNKYGPGMYRVRVKKGEEILINDPLEIVESKEGSDLGESKTVDQTSKLILEYIKKTESEKNDAEAQEMRFLRKMEIYKNMFASPVAQGGGGMDILGVVGLLEKLGLSISRQPEESFTDVVKTALPVFEQMAARIPEKEKKPIEAVNPVVRFFLDCARDNGDPALYAHVLIDRLPAKFIDVFVKSENYQELIEKLNKDFAYYPGWVAAVRKEMIEILREEEAENEAAAEEEEPDQADQVPRGVEGGEMDSKANLSFG